MMARLRGWLIGIRDSYWFVPSVALLVAVALAVGLVELDVVIQVPLDGRFPRLLGGGAEGARGTLTAIAGSMMTVAGVVFSVTIVALSLTASAYSPRVLRTFMRDRASQAAFGVFVGVFVYCLIVLRTVRVADEGAAFVPSIAVLGALVLAVAAAWVLVFFIHHIAVAVQVSSILNRIAADTRATIDRLYPPRRDDQADDALAGEACCNVPAVPGDVGAWRMLCAPHSGYIVAIDIDGLYRFACQRDAVVRLELAIGEFSVEGEPLVALAQRAGRQYPAGDEDSDSFRELRRMFVIRDERAVDHDAAFGLQQIVDVAARALSPGINDPGTATSCIDHLSALLARLARRPDPDGGRAERGVLRVIARQPTFEQLAEQVFEPLLRYAAGKTEVLAGLARAARIVERSATPDHRQAMQRHIAAIERARRG